MRQFLIEYYTYAATVSMISIDPRFSTERYLSPDLQAAAESLVTEGYIGHLCGCWLELLLLIPRIFELGRRAFANVSHDEPQFPTADDMVEFTLLQNKIALFYPNPSLTLEVSLAGLIFQKSMMLYLFAILDTLSSSEAGPYSKMMSSTTDDALMLLESLPSGARINTSLCWPIAVIGSLISSDTHKRVLRTRLEDMSLSLGLGNIRVTLLLLERMWFIPLSQRSPWTCCRTMQEYQMWLSFA